MRWDPIYQIRELEDGLNYETSKYKETRFHVLRVDLTKRFIRPLPVGDRFPFTAADYATRPAQLAKDAGALASVGGGFSFTSWHGRGIKNQPLHGFAVDGEVWTTGIGHGGHAFLTGDEPTAAVIPSRTEIKFWNEGQVVGIDHVNLGNEGNCLFTYRGGTNAKPEALRYHTKLTFPGPRTVREDGKLEQRWVIGGDGINPPLSPDIMVIETDEPIGWDKGSIVRMVTDFNYPNTLHQIAGPSELVRDGVNYVPSLDLFGEASHGPDNWYIRKNPRQGIAVTKDEEEVLLVTVEGRIRGSRGYRLKEFAALLIDLGAYNAVNMDGGGSAHMWVRGMGLVADSCYGDGTLDGLRPEDFSTGVF